MPRKEFQQDVSKLLKLQQAFDESSYLRGLARGDEDGMLVFRFHYAGRRRVDVSLVFNGTFSSHLTQITPWWTDLFSGDLHTYPDGCSGFCFLDDSHADFRAAGAAEAVANVPISRQSIFQCFESCIIRLCDIFKTPSDPLLRILAKGTEASNSEGQVERGEVETFESDSSDDDCNYGSDLDDSISDLSGISDRMRELLLRDVNELISCGYKHQGYLTWPAENGFILYSSIWIQELVNSGILTQDQCLAWNLEPSKYMFMLMKFGPEYIEVLRKDNISYIRGMDTNPTAAYHPQPLVEFRVVTGDVPSLSATDGIGMFQANTANNDHLRLQNKTRQETRRTILSPFFLSWSLADILNRRFLVLLSYRLQFGLNWAGAELMYERRNAISGNQPDPCFPSGDPHTRSTDWDLCRSADAQELTFIQQHRHADQLNSLSADPADSTSKSNRFHHYLNFPLLALRYVIRRLALASRFCLVCHRQINKEFEPLKPFVCDSALCTYQYFHLGLGASIEQEIIHHPGVVDMLVSLAYVAAANQKLDPFPHGVGYMKFAVHPNAGQILLREGNFLSVQVEPFVRLAVGDMIEYCYQGQNFRVKVLAIDDYLEISDELPIINKRSVSFQDQQIPFKIIENHWLGWPIRQAGAVRAHEHKLVVQTLDQLPPIKDLQNALNQQLVTGFMQSKWSHQTEAQEEDSMNANVLDRETESKRQKMPQDCPTKQSPSYVDRGKSLTLRSTLDSINRLLYPLLRWIICSNRSHVKELVDDKEKVAGVGVGYWQFKMVMSNPDKEERFLKEQRALTARKHVKSLWAFHGSPLYNWHSILRTGLNFNQIVHGRSYGHGIYHAFESVTSLGYASRSSGGWPGSKTGINLCLSLNEIVNCPENFSCTTPYLVVPNIDWVQTRFLFVRRSYSASETASQTESLDQQFTCEADGVTYVPMNVNYTPSDGYQRPIRVPLSSAIAPVPESPEHNFVDPGLLQLAKEEEARTRRNVKRQRSVEPVDVLHGEDDMVNFNARAPSKREK
ncbi:uncharacterized protein SPPG_00897 [Spizellomyces punctatus DAOM BR117]|uniref:PARP catalytic domain-containing protein n=1 Tax=Spizellomyces punctatus (strain DAOM BR117) TaxID=645134 RepID=A0A0L0HPR8_SPIPD|nr:uncharacterized protein SPPG_00897 [Spizellomyces punctatus DAOM BR117]KND03411.1 hypothetical protein SPPG_00897 [Spizellomyces punctatus DAOM BR117]|eukprot:XP_016611450.1 hypothetical protein SPPG_00897 [Spizellomyces punctatus DAOM BR117]